MITLRPYQEDCIKQLRVKYSQGKKRVIIWLATGAGKGLIMSELVNSLVKNGFSVLTVMARREVVFQTDRNYLKYHGIRSSIVMGSNTKLIPSSKSFICSIDTLKARGLELVKHCDFCIVDEAHDCPADRYKPIFATFQNVWGCTATPFSPLSMFEDYICPITPGELRDQGFLVPAKHYSHTQIDTTGIRSIGGDFNQSQLAKRASELKIVGDIVDTWKKHGENRRTILFAVNKAHSAIMAEAFRRDGVPALHIDESHNKLERENAINELTNGSIKVLCNVNIFSTGVDIPSVSCLSLARPTQSEILYIQQIGRGLRPFPGKEDCIILDHAGNIYRHGDAFQNRSINLTDKPKKKEKEEGETISVVTCKKCLAVIDQGVESCPFCGYIFEKKTPKHVDGELQIIIMDEVNVQELRYVKIEQEYEKLKRLSEMRNFKINFKYFKLFEKYGNDIYFHDNKLGIPSWIPKIYEKQQKEKAQHDEMYGPLLN